jgi:hypothetical protein
MKKLFLIGAVFVAAITSWAQSSTNTVMVQVPATVVITTNIPDLLGSIGSQGIGTTLSMLYNDTIGSSNFIVAPFAGRKLTGNASCAGVLAAYDINQNIGLVGGIDHLWSSGAASSTFTLSGGLQIQAVIHPFNRLAFLPLWLQNEPAHPFAMSLVGAPMSGQNSGNVMNLNRVGIYFDIPVTKTWQFDIGAAFGNRTGCGPAYDGNWVNLFIAFGYKIPGQ